MCGIAGIWLREPLRESELEAMVDALTHRGPDDRGVWLAPRGASATHNAQSATRGRGVEPCALRVAPFQCQNARTPERPPYLGLGHTRLAVLDLSPAGRQPMLDPRTGNRIVYNGEVYNFREIRRTLERQGMPFESGCDTEVLLQAYAVWGPACVRRFRGMFAFAIWDENARRLFLARDRMGIKPLYYFHDGRGFRFASELRALLASGQVPRELSLPGLASFLAFGSVSEPDTLVAGVRMLPAGHTALFDGRDLRLDRYWGLDGTGWEPAAADRPRNAGEAVEAVRARLQEAVRLRLVSDAPIGAFLSGGIDSSAVVSLMAQGAPDRVRTVSICFEESAFDESAHSERIARQNGTDHLPVVLTAAEVRRDLGRALSALDQPSVDGANTWFVSRAARQAGLTVALSGLGGDELFAGYAGFRTVPRLERLRRLAACLPAAARGAASAAALRTAGRWGNRTPGRKVADLLAFAPEIRHAAVMQRALFAPREVADLVGEPRAESVLPAYALPDELLGHRGAPIRQLSVIECGHYMRNTLLRDADTMSMAHALEVRVPLIDHRLVELVLSLEARWKVGALTPGMAGTPKPLLVHAVPNPLPASVVHRPKRGFTFPFEPWLRGPLGQEARESLCAPTSALAGWLSPQSVARVWQEFLDGRVSWSRPWALYVLERWITEQIGR
jgi:asparagine synthase (glutamine-hydrolysing)